MNTFVIDASVVIKWVVDEPGTAQTLLLRRHRLLAPDLLIADCANILWKKVRRNELLEEEAMVATGLLARSDIEFEPMISVFEAATRMAILLDPPAYDCCYLALAASRGCTFVTADEALVGKCRSAGLPIKVAVLGDMDLA
nr:type II toxin-antitoxin system VapC family toxin [uncultured Rhodopila sp.]